MAAAIRSNDSVTELIKQCQKAASDKQYSVALDIANAAVQASEHDRSVPLQTRVTLLDLRTALHIRRQESDLALKDAKTMIRVDRTDGRGYVRCGQIERHRGNLAVAVTFYEHGLKHVAATDRYSQLIAKELAAVEEELRVMTVLANAKDPMTTLPLEIVTVILSSVSYRQHVQLLQVCKAWNRLLSSLCPLTDTLAFPDAGKDITPKMLHASLRRLKTPKTISAHRLTVASSEILARTLENHQNLLNLQHLDIQDKRLPVWQLPLSKYDLRSIKLGPDTAIPFDLLPTILKECANLEVAQFKNVTGSRVGETYLDRRTLRLESQTLRVFHAHVLTVDVEFEHDMLFAGLPGLESLSCMGLSCIQWPTALKLVDLRHMKQLETFELERCTMPAFLLPPSLRRIRFSKVIFQEDPLLNGQGVSIPAQPKTDYQQLENLESLTVHDCPMYPRFVHYPAQTAKAGRLEEFRIGLSYESLPSYPILFQTGWSKGFKRVHVKGECFEDSCYKVFLEHCPALEELSLDGAMITGLFVSDFVRARPPKLRKITLKNCAKVSNDVVAWAKEWGVEVALSRGGQELRGRRVRYAD